jgi:hypothetical protein
LQTHERHVVPYGLVEIREVIELEVLYILLSWLMAIVIGYQPIGHSLFFEFLEVSGTVHDDWYLCRRGTTERAGFLASEETQHIP